MYARFVALLASFWEGAENYGARGYFERFRVQNAPYPNPHGYFFAKHRMDWIENHHIVEDTTLSYLCQIGGVLSQCYTTKNPCREGKARFVREIVLNRTCKRGFMMSENYNLPTRVPITIRARHQHPK